MRDLLPDDMERLRVLEDAFGSVCRAWGYREIRTPVIEPLHLFTAAGTLSPRTLERVYSFLDWDGWSGERVVLRPDSTIPAARLYAEHLDGGQVAKLFYNQNIFRFTDDGSPREEWQCGVELMGDTGILGDIELVMLALESLRTLAVPTFDVCLSHAGIVRAVLSAAGMTPEEQSLSYDRLLDGDLTVIDEVEARVPQLNAPLRLLFDVEGAGCAYIENLRGLLSPAIPALVFAFDELAAVAAALEAVGVTPTIRTVLARNFEYYSGLILRIESEGKRLIAGGRYDDLIGLIGRRHVPASGFALHLAPLLERMPSPAQMAGGRKIVVQGDGAESVLITTLFDAAARLRAAGLRAESIEGMDSAPTHRLICRLGSPAFTLIWPDGTQQFERLADVVRVLEPDR
jgi:histidyl-tRNA synthetase